MAKYRRKNVGKNQEKNFVADAHSNDVRRDGRLRIRCRNGVGFDGKCHGYVSIVGKYGRRGFGIDRSVRSGLYREDA